MEPLHTPPRSDTDPIGAPTRRPYDEPAAPPPSRTESEYETRGEPTWTGNRRFARLEPFTGAIVGGLALIILGFLVLVASLDLRWVVGLAFIAFGIAAFVWANARSLANEPRRHDTRTSDLRY